MTVRYGIDFSEIMSASTKPQITHVREADVAKQELLKAFDERDRRHFEILLNELFSK